MIKIITDVFNVTRHATLTLPSIEVTLLIVILTVCLLFKFTRIGLFMAYLFVYRWGWLFFMDQPQNMLLGYMTFGCLVGILTIIGMVRSPP